MCGADEGPEGGVEVRGVCDGGRGGGRGGGPVESPGEVNARVGRFVAAVRGVVGEVGKGDGEGWFEEVPTVGFGGLEDYHSVVRDPVDWGMVRVKAEQGGYGSVEEVRGEVRRMTENCVRYNGEGSEYATAARGFENRAEGVIEEFMKTKKGAVLQTPVGLFEMAQFYDCDMSQCRRPFLFPPNASFRTCSVLITVWIPPWACGGGSYRARYSTDRKIPPTKGKILALTPDGKIPLKGVFGRKIFLQVVVEKEGVETSKIATGEYFFVREGKTEADDRQQHTLRRDSRQQEIELRKGLKSTTKESRGPSSSLRSLRKEQSPSKAGVELNSKGSLKEAQVKGTSGHPENKPPQVVKKARIDVPFQPINLQRRADPLFKVQSCLYASTCTVATCGHLCSLPSAILQRAVVNRCTLRYPFFLIQRVFVQQVVSEEEQSSYSDILKRCFPEASSPNSGHSTFQYNFQAIGYPISCLLNEVADRIHYFLMTSSDDQVDLRLKMEYDKTLCAFHRQQGCEMQAISENLSIHDLWNVHVCLHDLCTFIELNYSLIFSQ